MKTIHIALVSTSDEVGFAETTKYAAALKKQLTRDFAPIWKIHATIKAVAGIDQIPESHWRMIIKDGPLPEGGLGFHYLLERNGADPVGAAEVSATQDHVSLTCSHELLEMLVNPTDKSLSEPSIPPFDPYLPNPLRYDTRVNFLKEICDPCQAVNQGYDIDGVRVSNFCIPEYYGDDQETKRRFFQGGSGLAREVLGGGYVSFQTADEKWWRTQLFFGAVNTSLEPDIPARFQRRAEPVAVPTGRSAYPREVPYPQPPTLGTEVTRPPDAARP